jgi:hypothetical protein
MREAATVMAKAATAAGVSTAKKDAKILIADARSLIGPHTDLHHRHLVAEVEAEAGGHTLIQNPLVIGRTHVMRGNVPTNT